MCVFLLLFLFLVLFPVSNYNFIPTVFCLFHHGVNILCRLCWFACLVLCTLHWKYKKWHRFFPAISLTHPTRRTHNYTCTCNTQQQNSNISTIFTLHSVLTRVFPANRHGLHQRGGKTEGGGDAGISHRRIQTGCSQHSCKFSMLLKPLKVQVQVQVQVQVLSGGHTRK